MSVTAVEDSDSFLWFPVLGQLSTKQPTDRRQDWMDALRKNSVIHSPTHNDYYPNPSPIGLGYLCPRKMVPQTCGDGWLQVS